MFKNRLNLQLFGEGGDGGEGTASSNAIADVGLAEDKSGGKPEVIYGKQNIESTTDSEDGESAPKKASFDDLIKGEYKEDFEKKTQAIINKRFKETKGLEEKLSSHNEILSMLSSKYGVDDGDIASLQKAIEDDESFYEEEAFQKGLTVAQLKEMKTLQRENEAFKKAQEEAEARAKSDEIYSGWLDEAEELKARYGLTDFAFENEIANPDFCRLLENGISVESAYKALHIDDMLGGAMAKTASAVREGLANSIASRQGRPAENGISPSNASQIFKTDPSKFDNKDMEEIRRQVMGGAIIRF